MRVGWIERDRPGRLGIIAKPASAEELPKEVADLESDGVDEVVCLLTQDEIVKGEMQQERELCEAHGIKYKHFAIPDHRTPLMDSGTDEFIRAIKHQLDHGRSIAIHCNKGRGRSGVIAAAVMALEGVNPDDAFHKVGWSRLRRVPDNREQVEWVRQYAKLANPFHLPAKQDPRNLIKPAVVATLMGIGAVAAWQVVRRRRLI